MTDAGKEQLLNLRSDLDILFARDRLEGRNDFDFKKKMKEEKTLYALWGIGFATLMQH